MLIRLHDSSENKHLISVMGSYMKNTQELRLWREMSSLPYGWNACQLAGFQYYTL